MIQKKTQLLRADEILASQQELSLDDARKLILAGLVRINADRMVISSSEMLDRATILLVERPSIYVSRGAYKLKPSLEKYLKNMNGLVAADIGASTGGFTDLMLQSGASKVYAVDTGHSQLHYRLRMDNRVINMEKVNARNIPDGLIPERVDVITMDLSFISVLKVLPSADRLLKSEGWAFILVKPQFEARSCEVGKGGVVRDQVVIDRCISSVSSFITATIQWQVLEILPSPILGPKGNQEYLMTCRKK